MLDPKRLKCSREIDELMTAIAERLTSSFPDVEFNPIELRLNLVVAYTGGFVDLAALEQCDATDLGHDIGGISKYLDRDTGALLQTFYPRCHPRDDV